MNRAILVSILLLHPQPAPAQAPSYPDRSKLLVLREADGKESPIKNAEAWAKRRAQILVQMQEVMGPLPDSSRKVPLDVKVDEEVRGPHYIRRKLTFAVEKGGRVPAYLLVPNEPKPHWLRHVSSGQTFGRCGRS